LLSFQQAYPIASRSPTPRISGGEHGLQVGAIHRGAGETVQRDTHSHEDTSQQTTKG